MFMQKYFKFLVIVSVISTLASLAPQTAAADNPNAMVENIVNFYFADVPTMIDIARCETGFRQYNSDGSALHDASGTYVGVFQISEQIHTPKATALGFDIRTIDGNLGYARYLYTSSGTGPWKGCLPKIIDPIIPPVAASAAGSISLNLRIGMTNSQVLFAQQILNRSGFVVAVSGPGSPGNETNYFGSLTREAVKKLQCSKGIVCDGNESTTGFGRIGPATRAVLNSL
jgi:hypothetical protein